MGAERRGAQVGARKIGRSSLLVVRYGFCALGSHACPAKAATETKGLKH